MFELLVFENHFGVLPYPIRYKPYLFNEVRHIESQKPFDNLVTFVLFNKAEGYIDARLQIIEQKSQGFSPFRATFGGIEYSDNLPEKELSIFFNGVMKHPKVSQLSRLTITEKPNFYDSHTINWQSEKVIDTNQHLLVNTSSFINRIVPAEKRRLKKCINHGFSFEEIKNPDFDSAYQFVKINRERKGRPTTMNAQTLASVFEQMPNDYKLFVVKDGQKVIAMTILVKLNEDAQYIFLPADDASYHTFSPSVMLFNGVYAYCQQSNAKVIDFGISSEAGVLNEGLFRFKKNLGCVASEKITFRKVD